MSTKLKILLTNHNLADRAGTQLYIRDLALELQKTGHSPFVYSPIIGQVAKELRFATIPVVSDLTQLTFQPDVIHGHHQLETLAALLHFPNTPALFVCHGWFPWQEAPIKFPRIFRYVAIDSLTYNRLVIENGIPEANVRLILNSANMQIFKSRASLPQKPVKALVYSNHIGKNMATFKTIQKACHEIGIETSLIGFQSGHSTSSPEKLLLNYDIVFAIGRSAIEALATGAAVVICSGNQIGPMVNLGNLEECRKKNFGLQTMQRTTSYEAVLEELRKYNPSDAALVCDHLRQRSCIKQMTKDLVELYQEIVQIPHRSDPKQELHALSNYLHQFSKEFQTQEIANREKLLPLLNLYHCFNKIPFLIPIFKRIKKMLAG